MEFFLLCSHPTLWRPEYGSYMIEGTPGQPYGGTMSEFNTVEDNMRKRRKEATSLLGENQALCTITSFPRLVPVWTCPSRSFRALGSKRADHDPSIWPDSSHTLRTVHALCAAFDRICNVMAAGKTCVPVPAGGWRPGALRWEHSSGLWARPWGPPWLLASWRHPPEAVVERAARLPSCSDPVRRSWAWWCSFHSTLWCFRVPVCLLANAGIGGRWEGHLVESWHQCSQSTVIHPNYEWGGH